MDGSDPRNGVGVLSYSSAIPVDSSDKGFYRIRAYCTKTDSIDFTVTDLRIVVA